MCGFAGEFFFRDPRASLPRVEAMASRLAHRGPDEAGSFLSGDGRCAMAFRRLSVIDPANSHQPVSSNDGEATVVFNGEIYNFQEIRKRLLASGVKFKTRGDAEILPAMYQQQQLAMVDELVGMFAFGIYDARRGRLVLGRDRLGQKPLWYAVLAEKVLFASEAKALLQHPDMNTCLNVNMIGAYLTLGYVPGPDSIWRNIRKLPPASLCVFEKGPALPNRYWNLPQEIAPAGGSDDAVEIVREQLTHAVSARMLSDVPLGALLSGGVDSAVIVALMCKSAGSAGGVRTFSAGFDDPRYDERYAAAKLARHLGCDHTELLVKPQPDKTLDWVARQYDEPFGDSSAVPTYLICRAAREHVTVALCGDGGDEVFGGYDRYRAMLYGETLGPLAYLAVRLAAAMAKPFAGLNERGRLKRLIRFSNGLTLPPALQYFSYRRLFSPDDLKTLLSEDFLSQAGDLPEGPAEWFCNLFAQANLSSESANAQRHDMQTYLPDDLLVKADIASMAASLELRAPMLDHRVVETGLTLPAELKLSRRHGKIILNKAFGDLLPAEVFNRPKRGFAVPLDRWLREDLREQMIAVLTAPALLDKNIFRPDALAGLMNDHLQRKADHSHRLWALMVLGNFLLLHQ